MECLRLVLRLVFLVVWMKAFSSRRLLVSAETCGALTTAADGQDPKALRCETIQAFRRKCRPRKCKYFTVLLTISITVSPGV